MTTYRRRVSEAGPSARSVHGCAVAFLTAGLFLALLSALQVASAAPVQIYGALAGVDRLPSGEAFRPLGKRASASAVGSPRPRSEASEAVVVKYRSSGAHGLSACAERISRKGGNFADFTKDGAVGLDQIVEEYGLGPHRALFRRTLGFSLEDERSALSARLASKLAPATSGGALPGGAPGASDLPDLSHVYRIQVPRGVSASQVVAALRADPHVEYAQPDWGLQLDQALSLPDDPFLQSSGSWGQNYSDLWGLSRVGAPAVWDLSRGEGIVVAVVDTGLDRFHPDIAENVWLNRGEDLNGNGLPDPADLNGLDDDQNGYIDDLTGFDFAHSVDADQEGTFDGPHDRSDPGPLDDVGHGTHIAGTIAAVGNNGEGIIGVAPRARVMALKGFSAEGSASDSDLWRAVLYAAENGASVVNNSWSCGTPCPRNPLAIEVLDWVEAMGTVVVTSAGNASTDVVQRSPENDDRVLTVGSIGFEDQISGFSNRGWGIDVVAPGGGPNGDSGVRVSRRNILSLLSSEYDPNQEPFRVEEDYLRLAGTSMAAPHVTGAVALLRSMRPDLSPEQVRSLIRSTGRDLGLPGPDPLYGRGLLDLPALLAAKPAPFELKIEEPMSWVRHDPDSGPLRIYGRVGGPDFERLEWSVAPGLSGRTFEPIETFQGKRGGLLLEWDVLGRATGPYVLRARAIGRNGVSIERYRIVSLEREAPARVSWGEDAVGAPAIAGLRVVYPSFSSEPGEATDLVLSRLGPGPDAGAGGKRSFRSRSSTRRGAQGVSRRTIFEGAENPTQLRWDGRWIAWRESGATGGRVKACRVRGRALCKPISVEHDDGFIGNLSMASRRLVWQRYAEGGGIIEGCLLDRRTSSCRPEPVVEDLSGTTWTLRSFDGRTLLLQSAVGLALCRLRDRDIRCRPEPITFADGVPRPSGVLHSGRLIGFTDATVELRPGAGCLPGETNPVCQPQFVVVARYQACWLDEARLCDPIPISSWVRIDLLEPLQVSGRRLAWSIGSEVEPASVRHCEFLPALQSCVEQRPFGGLGDQRDVALAGDHLAWREAREDPVAIWGHALPALRGPGRVQLKAGSPFSIRLRATGTSTHKWVYSAEAITGTSPSEARVRLPRVSRSGRIVSFKGVWPRDGEGVHTWRFRAETPEGAFSDWVVTLDVAKAPNAWERRRRGLRRGPRRWSSGEGRGSKPGR